jgi:predicted nuclease with TOPRIM domain
MLELRTAQADLHTKKAELDDVVIDLGEQLQALTQANTALQTDCEQRLAAQQVAHDQAMAELRTAHACLQTKYAELDDVVVDLSEHLQALTQANTVAECEQRLAAQQAAHGKAMVELRTAQADLHTKNAELDDVVIHLGEQLQALTQANTAAAWTVAGGPRHF